MYVMHVCDCVSVYVCTLCMCASVSMCVSQRLGVAYPACGVAIHSLHPQDNDLFMTVFTNAWTKAMILDRFDGPTGNVCR